MSDKNKISIISIGHDAYETIQDHTSASTLGITSKGIFAVTPDNKVFFISDQPYRGPLTINIQDYGQLKPHIALTSKLILKTNMIHFRSEGFTLGVNEKTIIWKPLTFSAIAHSKPILRERVDVIQKLCEQSLSGVFSELVTPTIARIHKGIIAKNYQNVLAALTSLLGYGTGLTPAGDDFICGFLLAGYYWNEQMLPGFPFTRLVNELLAFSQQKTTTLSTNLIACAAHGSADERLIAPLQWITNGNGNLNTMLEELRTFGSSSGSDTLQGMTAFFTAVLE